MSQTIKFPVALGDEVRDVVTGFTGIVVSLTEWFNSCQRASVQPKLKEDGSIPNVEAFDVEQLEIVHAEHVKRPRAKIANPTGGPMPAPQRREL